MRSRQNNLIFFQNSLHKTLNKIKNNAIIPYPPNVQPSMINKLIRFKHLTLMQIINNQF